MGPHLCLAKFTAIKTWCFTVNGLKKGKKLRGKRGKGFSVWKESQKGTRRSMRENVLGAEKCFWWEGRRHVGVEGFSPHGVQL